MRDRNNFSDICLVGHPYAPIGMGEHVRATHRALSSVGIAPRILDIYGLNHPAEEEEREFSVAMGDRTPGHINIFHINGDEVEQSLQHISYHAPWTGYNIIYPAWELSRYPKEWAIQLDRFDEIWAPSKFVGDAIRLVSKPQVIDMPLACEVRLTKFLSRRYFGLPESYCIFLNFFDIRSYVDRKNPFAVLEAFRRLVADRPFNKLALVLKVNGAEQAPELFEEMQRKIADIRGRVIVIGRVMSDNEIKNLIRCCDCFVSLHRSEGYGRGMAEAMYLGKPVIATGYSGNMDFMNGDVAYLVGYDLIEVKSGQYPFFQGQFWADPNISQATELMGFISENPNEAKGMGQRGQRHIKTGFSFLAIGLRYRERIDEIRINRAARVEL